QRQGDVSRGEPDPLGAHGVGGGGGGEHAPAVVDPLCALPRLGDAGGGDRVGAQVVGQAGQLGALVDPRHRLHAFEHAGHRVDVVAAARQGAHADAVGLGLVGAGVVDL